jgi:hypothetical protein
MSNLSTEALSNPEELRITWYPEDQPPSSSSPDYSGITFIGDIYVSSDQDEIGTPASQDLLNRLEFERGPIAKYIIDSTSSSSESGRIRFDDGTEVDFTFENVGEQKHKYTLAGKTFKTGGGW